MLLGKYGDEGDKLIFKILRRGEHEASGEADLALRYDHDGAAGPGGRRLRQPAADRRTSATRWARSGGRTGRARAATASSPSATWTRSAPPRRWPTRRCSARMHDVLAELGIGGFRFLLNSRRVLAGLLEAFGVPAELGAGVLIIAGQAGQARAPARSRRSWAAAGWPGQGRRAGRRDDRARRGGPDQGRAQAERGGRGRAWMRWTGCCRWWRRSSRRAGRVHPADGARPELLHRADLGGGRARGGRARSAAADATTT